ncbi:hypothetical protein P4V47_23030 [Brevibacillus laterosporus]|uniref:hypothetical protein n=1 Tax=Brevibacillus laterosporus TaxID=1465 RepID=UPI002E1EAAD8|nr:hypothetical protein [Brevibacillus laterosporus]
MPSRLLSSPIIKTMKSLQTNMIGLMESSPEAQFIGDHKEINGINYVYFLELNETENESMCHCFMFDSIDIKLNQYGYESMSWMNVKRLWELKQKENASVIT